MRSTSIIPVLPCASSRRRRSRDNSVGIVTGYGLDDRGVGVRVPVGSRFSRGLTEPLIPEFDWTDSGKPLSLILSALKPSTWCSCMVRAIAHARGQWEMTAMVESWLAGELKKLGEKSALLPLRSPGISHEIARDWTGDSYSRWYITVISFYSPEYYFDTKRLKWEELGSFIWELHAHKIY
jgi:hypothetical protein